MSVPSNFSRSFCYAILKMTFLSWWYRPIDSDKRANEVSKFTKNCDFIRWFDTTSLRWKRRRLSYYRKQTICNKQTTLDGADDTGLLHQPLKSSRFFLFSLLIALASRAIRSHLLCTSFILHFLAGGQPTKTSFVIKTKTKKRANRQPCWQACQYSPPL